MSRKVRSLLVKLLENMSLFWEYSNMAAMGLVQGTLQTLPAETWKTQAPAFQRSACSSEINNRHMVSQFHLQGAVCIWETTDTNPVTDNRDFVSPPLWPACQVSRAKLFLTVATGCHFLLAAMTPWKPNCCHSLPVTNNRYMERQGSQLLWSFFGH